MTRSSTAAPDLPVLRRGLWGTHPDVLAGAGDGPMADLLAERGYRGLLLKIGPGPGVQFDIYTTGQHDRPRFYLSAFLGGEHFSLYAGDIVDLLDLLSRWAPLLTASTVDLVRREFLEPGTTARAADPAG